MTPRPVKPYLLPEGNVQIAFSGGRTSAYMLHHILEANGGLPDRCRVVFTNTGDERPETLDFIAECERRWGVPIALLERTAGGGFIELGHQGLSRHAEPFEKLIRERQFLPNWQARFCTVELKIIPAQLYLMGLGWTAWAKALGYRADEAQRAARAEPATAGITVTRWFPLIAAGVGRHDVVAWWNRQPFDLRLPTHRGKTVGGNCRTCFLKSEREQAALARDEPESHAWAERMEAETGGTFSSRFSKASLRRIVEGNDDWIFTLNGDGIFCQANDGECLG